MAVWFLASDLHGDVQRYRTLFERIAADRPEAVFLGGDLLPGGLAELATFDVRRQDFVNDFLAARLRRLREELAAAYPHVFVIPGNDDPRTFEAALLAVATEGLWTYVHGRRATLGAFDVYGYAFSPPSPYSLKDWERYDVSRFVDPGCVSPEEGFRTIPAAPHEVRHATIADDLERLTADRDLSRAVMLFHAPPHGTLLDRAALDARVIEHVPVDVHVGSIAIRRFIENRQPWITMHGHVHESARLTGAWSQQIGRTWCFTAAHDGEELALVRFDPQQPQAAERELV